MKLNKQAIIIAASVSLLILVAFQNCSQGNVFRAASNSEVGYEIGHITPTPEILQHVETSAASKIQFFSYQDGQVSGDLYLGEAVEGVVSNVGKENVWGCATYVERERECDDPAVWGDLSKTDWKYVDEIKSWVMSENMDALFVANKEFVMFFHDRNNDVKLRGTGIMKPKKIVAPSPCTWNAFVIGPSNPAKPAMACGISNAWDKRGNDGVEWTCYCPGVPNPNEVPIEMGHISNVIVSSKAYSYYDLLTGNVWRSPPALGGECVVGQHVEGRLDDCSADWLGENPNKYKICKNWTIQCSR